MGIHTKVLRRILVATVLCLLVFHSINFLMTMTEVEGFLAFRDRQVIGVFELMPSPIGHSVQGHTCPIIKREGLQTCYIDGGSKMSVTDGERGKVVGLGDDGVIAINNSVTVYGGRHVVYIIS